jgi:hypothetical protein
MCDDADSVGKIHVALMADVRLALSVSSAVALLAGAICTDVACSNRSSGSLDTTPPRMLRIVVSGDGVRPPAYAGRPLQVQFFNDDSENHRMLSDPHPQHDGCPEMMDLGVMEPQRSVFLKFSTDRRQGNIALPVCRYHDETRPEDPRFWGSIMIR